MRGNIEPIPGDLVVIARDATVQVVTHITSNRDLKGALHTAQSVLKPKLDAVRVEVHYGEDPTSVYRGKSLTEVSHEDLPVEQRSV